MRIQSSNKVGKVISKEGNFTSSLQRRSIFLIKEFGMLPLIKIPRTAYLTSDG